MGENKGEEGAEAESGARLMSHRFITITYGVEPRAGGALVDVRASYTTRIRAASRIRGSYFQSSYEARTAKLVYEARMAKARMVDLGTRLVYEPRTGIFFGGS